MQQSYKTYDSYKDSGVAWLGKIPESWDIKSLKAVFIERNEKNKPLKTKDILSLSIAKGVTPYSDEGRGGNKAKNDMTAYKLAYAGDIVLNSMNVIVGAVGLSRYFGAISPVYYALYPRCADYNIKYYNKIFQNSSFQQYLRRYGKGILIKEGDSGKLNTIRMKISMSDLNKLPLPVPPKNEQIKIAEFLDNKSAEIDEAIAKKERLIELIKEQKAIAINNAVTKGLNPNAPMKDSGIEWIGKIPEHWEVRKLRTFTDFVNRGTTPNYVDYKKTKVVNQATFSKGYWNEKDIRFSNFGKTKPRGQIVKNDILLASTGGGVLGKVAKFELDSTNYVADSHVTIIRDSKQRYCVEYLYNILSVNYGLINGILAQGSTNQTELQRNWLRDMPFPFPEKEEQQAIANHCTEISRQTEVAIKSQQKQITKLKEYKQTLIANVVTGKIKVA